MENKKFVDHYEVLGIWPTADAETVKKSYFKLAKIHHPDIAGTTGPDASGVDFKLINEAYATLSDAVSRRAYDEKLKAKTGGGKVTEHKDADRRSAQLAYDQARAAMKQNRYDKAAVLLKSAVKYDPSNASYHSWYGFTLGVLKTNLHEARDACKKALEIEFYNADYHANLGFVYMQAGLTSTAEESFEEALKWDPEHGIANKYSTKGKKASGSDGGFSLGSILSLFRKGGSGAKEKGKKKRGRPQKERRARSRGYSST